MKISRDHGQWSCLTSRTRRIAFFLFAVVVAQLCRFMPFDMYNFGPTTSLSNELEQNLKFPQPIHLVVHDPTHIQEAAPVSSNHTSPTSTRGKHRVIWSQARGDRSGSFIQDMLMCHAYAFHNDYIYGGACGRDTKLIFRSLHKELVDAMGLSNVLKFGCPSANVNLQRRSDYIKNDTGIFTDAYIKFLQSLIEYPTKPERRRIAVHIRRGDITPCRPRTRGYPRYLPNQHFLRLIDRYNPQNDSDVFIYSESKSFETFDKFRARGYHVVLDGSIGDVWKGILISDVAILSRSSFSLVPAVLTKGTVVYTEFWHKPLPGWEIVEEDFVNATTVEFRRLKATCPPKKPKKG